MDLIEIIKENWRAGVEVLVLWILIYQIYRVFRATRGARILVGLTVVIILMTLASQLLDLKVIEWIIKSAAAVLAFALLIIFQPELRNGLARLGSTNLFSISTSQQKIFLDSLTEAVMKLSKKRFGALFAIERGIELSEYDRTGVEIDSAFSAELVATIFHPKTALHDGGMILKKERIASAACIFPVSQKQLSDRSLGLRHRAGFGITEETDAVAVIVSEETGAVSIVVEEKIHRNLSEDEFREKLEEIFLIHGEVHKEMAAEELDGEIRRSSSGDRDQISD